MKLPAEGTIELIVLTTILALLVQKFSKKFLETLFKPLILLKEAIYKWLAPRNPLSISIRSYKKHLRRSNLAKIENPAGPSLTIPLERTYAPLKLISSQIHDTIELFDHAAVSHRTIVLGGPGTGKTTLMKSLLVNIINKKCHPELDKLLPVFIVLRNLATANHSVEEAIVEAFKKYHFPGAKRFVDSVLNQGRMLIIFDGLDELSINRRFVASQIRTFCEHDEQREKKNRVFITCRENSYRNEDLRDVISDVVRVEAFANHHMRTFLQGWPVYKGKAAIKLYGLIQQDPQLRDICRNPLLLTILAGLYLNDDKFELPKSRDNFYRSCIDELLMKRPVRRGIEQKHRPDDKRKILERVCLERLETTGLHDDPEALTTASIVNHARIIIKKEFDEHSLLEELTVINGIIKPCGDGAYTCAHRTIQEYFAAREARRTREPEQVIARFGSRDDLIEVMYFYCGLIDNIPQLNGITKQFIADKKWIEAGRCLLNMTEIVDEKHLESICRNLFSTIKGNQRVESHLAILSSLSQKEDQAFDVARNYFSKAIDSLAIGNHENGASALESVLSSSPEITMKLLPGLLQHHSPRWKKSAIKLLNDIGTDEALDRLVQLLNSKNDTVRIETAGYLANLIKTRGDDLKARKDFLPQRTDPEIWPLEEFFPGSIAIPIAESLTSSQVSKNKAINTATKAIKVKATKNKDNKFLTQWRHLPTHLNLIVLKKQISIAILFIILVTNFIFGIISIVGRSWGFIGCDIVFFSLTPYKIYATPVDSTKNVEEKIKLIKSDIDKKFSPNISGFAKLLPWNWDVKPEIPQQHQSIYEELKEISDTNDNPLMDIAKFMKSLPLHSDLASPDRNKALEKAIQDFVLTIPQKDNIVFYYYLAYAFADISVLLLTLSIFLLYFYMLKNAIREKKLFRYYSILPYEIMKHAMSLKNTSKFIRVLGILFFLLIFLNPMIFLPQGLNDASMNFRHLVFYGWCFMILVGILLYFIKIPQNPQLSALNDIQLSPGTLEEMYVQNFKMPPLIKKMLDYFQD